MPLAWFNVRPRGHNAGRAAGPILKTALIGLGLIAALTVAADVIEQHVRADAGDDVLRAVGDAMREVAGRGDAGVRVELDDFGTGHASLTHLETFPVHRIEIDRSFVAGIGCAAGDETIVRATIDIAASFGRQVIAEGVETENQRRFLVEHGCAEAQGYLFAPPLPATALLRWLDARRVHPAPPALAPR